MIHSEYPTIALLADFLKSQATVSKWKSLVPIKSTGTKAPLYIVHGGGLGVYVFLNLSKLLNKDQPLYGFQALGIDGIYKNRSPLWKKWQHFTLVRCWSIIPKDLI